MGILDRLTAVFRPNDEATGQDITDLTEYNVSVVRPNSTGTRAAGRLSRDSVESFFTAGANFGIHPPASPEAAWQAYKLDANSLQNLPATKLVELLIDLSPDVSRALWDYLRLCNPGYEVMVLQPGTEDPHDEGTAALDAFIQVLEERHGALDVIFGREFIGGWLRGAFLSELVLNEAGDMPLDIATPDPGSIRFKKARDPELGEYWQMGQWQDGEWVSLSDDETIRYIPVDPVPGSPYGRPLVSPALFATLFLLGLLHDLRRVVSQQGYPRLDVAVDLVRLKETMPPSIAADPKKFKQWVDDTIKEVIKTFDSLEPDETFVHDDAVTVNRPVGAVDASSLGAVDGLIRALERQSTRALKTMPILMGSNEATAETHASKQWEIMAAGITTLQHNVENMLSRQFELALQAQGILADVKLRFAQLRETERLLNAQTEAIEIGNAWSRYQYGWISYEQSAQEGAGVAEPAEDGPLVPVGGGFGGITEITTTQGTYRLWQPQDHRTGLRFITGSRIEVEGDAGDIPPVPTTGTLSSLSRLHQEEYYDYWNDVMPDDVRDILRAEAEEDENAGEGDEGEGEQSRRRGTRQGETEPLWRWSESLRRYRHTETGRIIGHADMLRLRDEFLNRTANEARSLVTRLDAGEINIREFTVSMRERLRAVHVDQYVLGRGGRAAMTPADWGHTGQTLRTQYQYLNQFAEKIVTNEDLTLAQLQVNAEYYVGASAQSFEKGRTAAFGISPSDLPQHPADGNQDCRTNCRCHWEHNDLGDRVESTWVLDPDADHCATCLLNADRYAPWTTYKEDRGRGRQELTQTPTRNGTRHTASIL